MSLKTELRGFILNGWGQMNSRLRYLGPWGTAMYVPYRLINLLLPFKSFTCVAVDLSQRHVDLDDQVHDVRLLRIDEIEELTRREGADVTKEFTRRAIDKGDECFGAMIDGVVESYVWVAHSPTVLMDNLTVCFDEGIGYVYKAFTMPPSRGRGLMPALLATALRESAIHKCRAVVACIESPNLPSFRAFSAAGFLAFETIHIAKAFGRFRILPSRGSNRFGFRVLREACLKAEPDGTRTSEPSNMPTGNASF